LSKSKIETFSSGSKNIFSIPTASYNAVFIDYFLRSTSGGTVHRTGNIVSSVYGGTMVTTHTSASYGSITTMNLGMKLSGSSIYLTGSENSTNNWLIKAVIRAI
jgi:hypothetical protein